MNRDWTNGGEQRFRKRLIQRPSPRYGLVAIHNNPQVKKSLWHLELVVNSTLARGGLETTSSWTRLLKRVQAYRISILDVDAFAVDYWKRIGLAFSHFVIGQAHEFVSIGFDNI